MSDQTKLEARLLTAAELEVVNATRPPAIEQASDEQLKVLAQRLSEPAIEPRISLPDRNARCVEKLTQREPSPLETTRVRSQRPKCWGRPLSALRRN